MSRILPRTDFLFRTPRYSSSRQQPPLTSLGHHREALCFSYPAHNALDSYGPRSDSANRYWFENFPNPGGEPTVGNVGFSLTTASHPGAPLVSVLAVSGGRSSVPVLGIELLVDPSVGVTLIVPTGHSVPLPLPIPADPSLTGITLYAQTVHVETVNALATSRGLAFTLR